MLRNRVALITNPDISFDFLRSSLDENKVASAQL